MNLASVQIVEACATVSGLVGAFLLAGNRTWSSCGWWAFLASNGFWLAFAWRSDHHWLFAQQVGFTGTSLLGLWRWRLRRRFYWGEWRGHFDGTPAMWIMRLASWRGFRLDLHKMVGADMEGCHHTHRAKAVRLVLWAGYVEEIERTDGVLHFKTWRPGMFGIVQPELSHRIAGLLNGRLSYSLWLRWPKTHQVQLRGPGWIVTESSPLE